MAAPQLMNRCKELQTTKTGPWGTVEYYYTFLDPPETLFTHSRRETTEWGFVGYNREQVEDFLSGCGVDVPGMNRDAEWIDASNGTIVRPSHSFLASLSAEVRQELYPRHIKLMENNTHLHDFVVERGAYRENAQGLNIDEEIINLVETRCVTMGKKTIFAETAYALSLIPDPAMKSRFLKSLARNRALIARLRIRRDSRLDKIAKWWKAGPNRTRALPLLENALRTPRVDSLDLIHLLPPVPRQLLNTFPTELDELGESSPDCYWTAMNFFGETASSRHLDGALPLDIFFGDQFELVSKGAPAQFGDISVISNLVKKEFVHAYVHIAGDIVFTKNGSGKYFPYILMRQEDLMSRYNEGPHLITKTYRLNALN